MENIYTILELPREASGSEIEEAYQARYEHWLSIQANRPERKSEAQEQIRRLEDAYEKYRQGLASGQVAGLEVRDRPSSGGTTASRPSVENKDACPHCRYKENPSNARFCLECNGQLFQKCPKCSQELPWHYQACHHCGVNIDAFFDQQRRDAAEAKARIVRAKREELEQIQKDLQQVKSPPLSAHFWFTGTGQKMRNWAGGTASGCLSTVVALGIVFGSYAVAAWVAFAIDPPARGSDSPLFPVVLLSVLLLLGIIGMRFHSSTFLLKPAMEHLLNREAQIRRELQDMESD